MDRNVHGTLGVKIQILLNLVCAHIPDNVSTDFQIVTELLELTLNFTLIRMREIRDVIRGSGNTGSLSKLQQVIESQNLNVLFRALLDVEHCREPGNTLRLEHSFQLIFGHCGFKINLRCDMG